MRGAAGEPLHRALGVWENTTVGICSVPAPSPCGAEPSLGAATGWGCPTHPNTEGRLSAAFFSPSGARLLALSITSVVGAHGCISLLPHGLLLKTPLATHLSLHSGSAPALPETLRLPGPGEQCLPSHSTDIHLWGSHTLSLKQRWRQ